MTESMPNTEQKKYCHIYHGSYPIIGRKTFKNL